MLKRWAQAFFFFFIFALQFPTFRYSFKVVQRAFHSESMTVLEIELVPN